MEDDTELDIPEGELPRIAAAFAEYFRHSKLTLPKSVRKRRKAGCIARKGWLIQYCFGKDERGEYLDFYSSHRMPGDDHRRLREDGRQEELPAMSTMIFFDPAVPGDEERARKASYAANQAIAKLLFEKGFTRFTLNMFLAEEPVPKEDSSDSEGAEGEPGKTR